MSVEAGRLRTFALAAIAGQVGADSSSAEARFLRAQLAQAGGPEWPDRLADLLAAPPEDDRPLIDLARRLDLTLPELLAAALAAAVEEDALVGRVLSDVQAPLGGSRPTLGLLASLVEGSRIPALAGGAALACGLLVLLGEGLPLAERPVALPTHLVLALHGQDGSAPGASAGDEEAALPLPPSLLDTARQQAASLSGRQLYIISSRSPAEGRAFAGAIAAAVGCRPLWITAENVPGLGPWLLLRDLLPVFVFDLGPGEQVRIPPIPAYQGPVLCVCGLEGRVSLPGYTAIPARLSLPSADERALLWHAALDDPDLAQAVARDHRHGSERIADLGRLAHYHAALHRRSRPVADDLYAALRTGDGAGLESLAQPIPDAIPDEALIVRDAIRRDLLLLEQRCRARERLISGLGAAAVARFTPGVRALFTGPSGTGKTLAAGWLATRLGLPLFRVDLAAVTSKYIGETEKNLAQLLARAEESEIVLLFDEADSLFGKRTEIKDSNDRFANAQTNYLLQRIETFDGIVMLTSNSRARFDASFTRRLDMIVDFPLPGAEERRALWLAHLGTRHRLSPREINHLAAVVDFAGGHIRSAVLMAAVLADGQPITYRQLVRGIAVEFDKLGRQMPPGLGAEESE